MRPQGRTQDVFGQSLSPSQTVWSPTGDTVGDQKLLKDSAGYVQSSVRKANQISSFFAKFTRFSLPVSKADFAGSVLEK